MLGEVAVVADDDDAVAVVDQFAAEFNVPGGLGGLVVDGAVTENAYVWGVEEVKNAPRLGSTAPLCAGWSLAAGRLG